MWVKIGWKNLLKRYHKIQFKDSLSASDNSLVLFIVFLNLHKKEDFDIIILGGTDNVGKN